MAVIEARTSKMILTETIRWRLATMLANPVSVRPRQARDWQTIQSWVQPVR